MRILLLTAVAACSVVFNVTAADQVELPLAAKNVLSTLERTVIGLQKKAAADLTAIMKKEAQAGRMDKAMALNEIIKELEAQMEAPALNAKAAKEEDKIIGRWEIQYSKFEITFSRGHRFEAKMGDQLNWQGSWKVEGDKLFVSHPIANSKDTFDLPPKKELEAGKSVYKVALKKSAIRQADRRLRS
jgi:hypothetical protein